MVCFCKYLYNRSTINANNTAPKESRWLCQVMTVMSPLKKKSAVVALSKWKMDCCFRKLLPLSFQLLSAVRTLVTNCHHVLRQCRLSLKPLGRSHGMDVVPNDIRPISPSAVYSFLPPLWQQMVCYHCPTWLSLWIPGKVLPFLRQSSMLTG